ncbi:hypothetical protein C8Q70DRAFT_459939 [Cubamyces menziesii]|nr:hypothetical protein C8Q70DRAFT_459939 [Cubamyces menziesii]
MRRGCHTTLHCTASRTSRLFNDAAPCCSHSSRNRTRYITISRLRRTALPPTRSGRSRSLTSFRDGLCDVSLSATALWISAGSYLYSISGCPCLACAATDPGRRGGIQPSHRARFNVGLNKGGAWKDIPWASKTRGAATPDTPDM